MKIKTVIIALIFLCLMGCSGQFVPRRVFSKQSEGQSRQTKETKAHRINLACWNVQTFFDAETAGTEYQDFKSNDKWNREKYLKRLETLCTVMTTLNPDIFVMEEIENEGVMMDISNFLAGEWDKKKVYAYGCFAKDFGGAIGCGVLSRWPIRELTVHAADFRNQKSDMPRMRPLMQLSVCKGSRILTLMVNHWKSMSGGENATEKWRNVQESVLSRKVGEALSLGKAVLCCGDFNRDINDFLIEDL